MSTTFKVEGWAGAEQELSLQVSNYKLQVRKYEKTLAGAQRLPDPGKEEDSQAGPKEEVESGRSCSTERGVKVCSASQDCICVGPSLLETVFVFVQYAPRPLLFSKIKSLISLVSWVTWEPCLPSGTWLHLLKRPTPLPPSWLHCLQHLQMDSDAISQIQFEKFDELIYFQMPLRLGPKSFYRRGY